MMLYRILDIVFFFTHAILTTFGLTGWIWKRTRTVHLAYMLLTGFSWIGLGLFFGLGYCFLTDWHWQVKQILGDTDVPRSFVKLFLDTVTNSNINPFLIDVIVAVCFIAALIGSIVLNIRDFLRVKRSSAAP